MRHPPSIYNAHPLFSHFVFPDPVAMLESAAHVFFSIPELVVLLSLHVHERDLTRCILVCKDWLRHFEPGLWRNLFMDDREVSLMKVIPPSRLAKNLRHIQAMDFYRANDTQLQLLILGLPYHLGSTVKDSSRGCTNLKHFNMWDLDLDCLELMSRPLMTLLDYNARLTRLQVPYEFFDIDGVSAAVSKLWSLEQLAINCDREIATLQKPYLFLQSCLALPQLTELSFHRDMAMFWDEGIETTVVRKLKEIINEATISRFSHPNAKRLKSLQLPCNPTGIRNPLPLLLLKSKLLDIETCELPWFRSDATAQEIEDVVRRHCPNLKHLQFPQLYDEGQDGQAARAFIRGCSGLESFTSAYFMDSTGHGPRMIISELVTQHHTTLKAFELTDPRQVNSRDLQGVLSKCKQMKRFWVVSDEEEESMSGIAVRDISRSDWICTELKELGVTLNRCRSGRDPFGDLEEHEEEDDPHEWLTASTTERAFQQIGRLKKLEVLQIDIDRSSKTKAKEEEYAWDLTVCNGYLGEWASLKNLRSLRLRADFWSHMNQEDVEFMHEHWPLLQEIIITSRNSEIRTERHWQWLLEKRPYMRFRVVGRNGL